MLVMKLQVVFRQRELDPDSSFTFINWFSDPYALANLTQPLVGSSSFVENGVVAIVAEPLSILVSVPQY